MPERRVVTVRRRVALAPRLRAARVPAMRTAHRLRALSRIPRVTRPAVPRPVSLVPHSPRPMANPVVVAAIPVPRANPTVATAIPVPMAMAKAPPVSKVPEVTTAVPVLPQLAPVVTSFYRGWDLHAYTQYLQARLPEYLDDLKTNYPDVVPLDLWRTVLQSIASKLGASVSLALQNMDQAYANGSIRNPELPGMNFAVLLLVLWDHVCAVDEPSLYEHFRQTLETIGTTCLAGITDRLFADWIAVHPL